jgi:hypothetical protein
MFQPKDWLNSGETNALPLTNRDLSRLEYAISGAVGKEINTQYLMKRNTYNISSCMTGDGWVGGSYAGSGNGTVSADTNNWLTGAHAVKCTISANLGGMYLTKTMDLSKFDSGLPSTDNDFIRYSVYLDVASVQAIGSLAIVFRTALNVSTNYVMFLMSQDYMTDGWNHVYIRKSDFTKVGTFEWANCTGVSLFSYPFGSAGLSFTLECLEMCRTGNQDSLYYYTNGNCIQPMGTAELSTQYKQDTTNLLRSTHNSMYVTNIENSKIWVNYSGENSCLKTFSSGTQDWGEFQVCEDFFMENGCVYEIQFKTVITSSNKYRINNLQYWHTDTPDYIEFYVLNNVLTCYMTYSNKYTYTMTSSFTMTVGHVYTMKIYRDNNYYVCVIWDNASTGVVKTVGGFMQTKECEVYKSQDYYTYAHRNTFRPFLEIRNITGGHISDIIYSIKQYKV